MLFLDLIDLLIINELEKKSDSDSAIISLGFRLIILDVLTILDDEATEGIISSII